MLDFLKRSEDGDENFDEDSLGWAGKFTGHGESGEAGVYLANHGWGGTDWYAGREWWGCYCWVALRTLGPGEPASEFATRMAVVLMPTRRWQSCS